MKKLLDLVKLSALIVLMYVGFESIKSKYVNNWLSTRNLKRLKNSKEFEAKIKKLLDEALSTSHTQNQTKLTEKIYQLINEQTKLKFDREVIQKHPSSFDDKTDSKHIGSESFTKHEMKPKNTHTINTEKLSAHEVRLWKDQVHSVVDTFLNFKQNNTVYQQIEKEYENIENLQANLPQVIIIGAKQCGVGALGKYLNGHPFIKTIESVAYFTKHKDQNLAYYKSQLPRTSSHEILIEKDPSYFFIPSVANKIFETFPQIKLINLVCDPINRIYSDYLHLEHRLKNKNVGLPDFADKVFSGLDKLKDLDLALQKQNKSYYDWLIQMDDYFTSENLSHDFSKIILRSAYSLFLKKYYTLFSKNGD